MMVANEKSGEGIKGRAAKISRSSSISSESIRWPDASLFALDCCTENLWRRHQPVSENAIQLSDEERLVSQALFHARYAHKKAS